jgi:formylglycine-generating enzyme required for sulfatase activity
MKTITWLLASTFTLALAAANLLTNDQATAEASVIGGLLASVTVVDQGSGYVGEPTVAVIGGGGVGATAKAILADGRVSLVVVLSSGTGYSTPPKVIISPPPRLTIKSQPSLIVYGDDGREVTIEKSNSPFGPWNVLTNVISSYGGIGVPYNEPQLDACFYRVANSSGIWTNNTPNNSSNTNSAVASAVIVGGFLTKINLISGGAGYFTEPKVTITGGGGNGATAKAFLTGDRVTSIVILTAGTGYSTSPDVIVESPPNKTRLKFESRPHIELTSQTWSRVRVEYSFSRNGPWAVLTNSTILSNGKGLLDIKSGTENWYFKITEVVPPGITGFVWIDSGSFMMGSPETEVGRNSLSKWEETQHQVTITRGFWMSDHEVTQSEYGVVTGIYASQLDPDSPVTGVSWDDAVRYCEKLTNRERLAGRISYQQSYRLPTEAEWEYACRAGTTGPRYGNLNAIAWTGVSASKLPSKVRLKLPNSWGLYDMIGNVWEWCSDWAADYPAFAVVDPVGPATGGLKSVRGGMWNFDFTNLRAAGRFRMTPDTKMPYLGFRPVLSEVR